MFSSGFPTFPALLSSSEQPIIIAIPLLFIFSHLHLTLSCGYSRPHIFSILLLVLYQDLCSFVHSINEGSYY